MCSLRASRCANRARNGSASRLALPLGGCSWLLSCLAGSVLAGCGEGESVTWAGVQDCAVAIPPESARGTPLGSVQLPLTGALVTPLGNGFSVRNFTLGPVGLGAAQFSCEASQVTARFEPPSALASPGATPGPGRAVELLPFECLGSDGRTYLLAGDGQASRDALFIQQTFAAWLGAERATLVCSSHFRRQLGTAADAGIPLEAVPFGPAPLDAPAP